MAQVQVGGGRADISCPNCGTTQSNQFILYWNTTTEKLEVEKHCVCDTVGSETPYKESFAVEVPEV